MDQTVKTAAMSIPDALGTSILGFAIVFFVLIVLMIMIGILRSMMEKRDAAMKAAAPAPAPAKVAAPAPAGPPAGMVPAKGSFGEVKLHDVDDTTAALLMAIVADTMQAPLNELRFISIREKK